MVQDGSIWQLPTERRICSEKCAKVTLAGRPEQLLFQIIRSGRGKMPAESPGRADDAEVRGPIRYIKAMVKDPRITAF
jgi:hypothetical protein